MKHYGKIGMGIVVALVLLAVGWRFGLADRGAGTKNQERESNSILLVKTSFSQTSLQKSTFQEKENEIVILPENQQEAALTFEIMNGGSSKLSNVALELVVSQEIFLTIGQEGSDTPPVTLSNPNNWMFPINDIEPGTTVTPTFRFSVYQAPTSSIVFQWVLRSGDATLRSGVTDGVKLEE